jgi:hypothetical protein
MNCVASTYNASGKLVGCTEQELNSIISVQLYTVFALGTGMYICRSFTADNWADIIITLGWGCISALTRTKRAVTKHVLPYINVGVQCVSDACAHFLPEEDDDSAVSDEDHSCIRVVKDGVETTYSSVFSFVQDLDEHFTAEDGNGDEDADEDADEDEDEDEDADEDGNEVTGNEVTGNEVTGNEVTGNEVTGNEVTGNDSDDESISELIHRIENHTMKFDFVLSEVCTLQTIMNSLDTPYSKKGMHIMKYDGFPVDKINGMHFYDRQFIPVDHRMMEIVLQYEGKEYDLDLASPDNFYVAGNKLLDFPFLKWFMLKNHGVRLVSNGEKCEYVIKCVDHAAVLHTLYPHNYLHVSILGFEVQDSGLI